MLAAPWWQRVALSAPLGPFFLADFTTLPAGAAASLFGLSHTRGSGATVQTGEATIATGLGTDVAGIGRALDADPLGLVIDAGRTNYLIRSADIGNAAAWSPVALGTQSSNNDASPDGGTAMGRIGPTAVSTLHFVLQSSTIPAGAAYLSTYAHRGTGRWIALYTEGGGAGRYFDLLSGSVGASGGSATGSIAAMGTGWRCHLAYTAALNSQMRFYIATADGNVTYAGAGEYVGLWGMQLESGAYQTEYIPTAAAAAARSGARLWHPTGLVSAGRIELQMVMQAKGAHSDYASDPYLWRVDAGSYATISKTDGKVTVSVAGASYTTASGITWAKDDVLDVRVMAGGGAANTVVKIGKNGAAPTTLGTSGAPQGTVATGACDLLQDGGAANVFSSRLRKVAAYAPGALLVLP